MIGLAILLAFAVGLLLGIAIGGEVVLRNAERFVRDHWNEFHR